MKKITAVLLSMVLVFGVFGVTAFAEDTSAQVYVTIALDDGTLAVAQAIVTVTDTDADGKLTINDALYCVHDNYGSSQGYATESTTWGIGIVKLWGVANGGSYGYYVNNVSAWSLTDPVVEGDYVNAFVYQDAAGFSDSYAYFSEATVSANTFETVDLTLYRLTYDADFNTVETPVVGAVITMDGVITDAITDVNGKVTVTLNRMGTHILSAQSEDVVIVAPVCTAEVGMPNLFAMFVYYVQEAFKEVSAMVLFILNLFD
jgi:hypothetical protein